MSAAVLILGFLAAVPGGDARAATGATIPVPGVNNPAGAAAGPLPVTLAVTVRLSKLHPSASKGALQCGAVAQTREWVGAHRDSLSDYDGASRWVLSPAHYSGYEAVLEFPIMGGSYSGALTFSTTLRPAALTDPSTHARFAPGPAVLVACWLLIDGSPALQDPGPGLQVVAVGNSASVEQSPSVVAVADAAAGTPISATAELAAQGRYFVPEPVGITGNVRINGPYAAGPAQASVAGNCTVAAGTGTGPSAASASWLAHADRICASLVIPGTAELNPALPSGPVQLLSVEYGAPTVLAPAADGPLRAGDAGTLVLRVTRPVDAATPFLLQAWVVHRTITTLTIQFQASQSGLPAPMRSYVLSNASVSQIRHFTLPDPGGGAMEFEEMLLAFDKLQLDDATGAICCAAGSGP